MAASKKWCLKRLSLVANLGDIFVATKLYKRGRILRSFLKHCHLSLRLKQDISYACLSSALERPG